MVEYALIIIFSLIILVPPFWKVFRRAGLNPIYSLFLVIPLLGLVICFLILALSKWSVSKNMEKEHM